MNRQNSFIVLIALLFTGVPCGVAGNRALLVGVGGYPDPQMRLHGIDRDIEHMRQVALKIGFKADEIKVLFDKDATLAGIRSGIKEWLGTAGPNDHALFYYSGHGGQIPDQPPLDEADGLDEVLIPYDTQLVEVARPSDNPLKNALVDDEFDILLRGVPSQHFTVILDSCFSGGALKGAPEPGFQSKFFDTRSKPHFPPKGQPRAKSDAPGAMMLYKSDQVTYRAILASREDEPAGALPQGSVLTNGIYKAVMEAPNDPTLMDILNVSQAVAGKTQHPLLAGRQDLWTKGVYLDEGAHGTPQERPHVSALFQNLVAYVASAPQHVDIQVNQAEQHVGDLLEIRFKAPSDGYVTIVNAAEDSEEGLVLFPNKFHSDTHVRKGEEIVLPGAAAFKLRASIHGSGAVQRNLIVAFFSTKPLPVKPGDPAKTFAVFTKSDTRQYDVEADDGTPFAAGAVVTTIRR